MLLIIYNVLQLVSSVITSKKKSANRKQNNSQKSHSDNITKSRQKYCIKTQIKVFLYRLFELLTFMSGLGM